MGFESVELVIFQHDDIGSKPTNTMNSFDLSYCVESTNVTGSVRVRKIVSVPSRIGRKEDKKIFTQGASIRFILLSFR